MNLIVGKTREMRRTAYYPQLYIVKEDGDAALRLWFLSHLIEDRAEPIMSYYQYLGHLKDRVRPFSFFLQFSGHGICLASQLHCMTHELHHIHPPCLFRPFFLSS